jgi:hypothetical protein
VRRCHGQERRGRRWLRNIDRLVAAKMSEHPLETLYWISQVMLLFVAAGASYAALQQLKAYKLFELTKYMDDPGFREARGIVSREIAPRKNERWWDDQDAERLRNAAYLVCAKFDVLQLMIEFDTLDRLQGQSGYGAFFVQNWAASILRTHDALAGYIAWRQQSWLTYYSAYDRLQRAAAIYRRDLVLHKS